MASISGAATALLSLLEGAGLVGMAREVRNELEALEDAGDLAELHDWAARFISVRGEESVEAAKRQVLFVQQAVLRTLKLEVSLQRRNTALAEALGRSICDKPLNLVLNLRGADHDLIASERLRALEVFSQAWTEMVRTLLAEIDQGLWRDVRLDEDPDQESDFGKEPGV